MSYMSNEMDKTVNIIKDFAESRNLTYEQSERIAELTILKEIATQLSYIKNKI